ncbi:tylosin biosynthesis-specific regulatory protein tylS [Candidatus Protofrankia californiensis]|uniref:Tylosin biosynthesis-specific regulatory protein tylS n=1 Tax=Candidatus Protofrankia californiensis TaxID=1839754 RepID=A0A1C3NYI0_9ACTN|nr:tylosin biosynthesis-specific regulatory protein tylS [Candidatus Protofrankia californiensis]
MGMEFGVLGPLILGTEGQSFLPSAPKPKQLLALLVLNANRVMSAASCIEELWSSDPPASAMSTLQTYVLHIRKALARVPGVDSLAAARSVLTTHDYGYALQVGPEDVDAFRFGMLVREGQRAQESAQHQRAAELLAQALAVWRGDVLVDVQLGPMLQMHARALEEARLGAWERRVESDLRLGRHHLLLGELVGRAAAHPVNENIHAQLMVALYRSGRPADALGVYLRLRTMLRRELGLDPSMRLQQLYHAVLRADPVLDSHEVGEHGLSLDLAMQRTGT